MDYSLSTTDSYHINDLNSLGWELTVCNALYPENSPCRSVLQKNASLGVNLYRFLEKLLPFNEINNLLEIGGGLGCLMRDFLTINPRLTPTMLDISPYLLERQKETLKEFNVNFFQNDILKMNAFSAYDLIIMNENLGDLPALVPSDASVSTSQNDAVSYLEKASYFQQKYNIPFAPQETINIGALTLLENICRAKVEYVYLSEHSCEAVVPDLLKQYINVESSGTPEKISLKGHNEYTIKFSYLQKIAEIFNYRVRRGPIADFLPLDLSGKVMTALRLSTPFTPEQEIIQQFIYDLYKYEYMVMIKDGK